METTPRQPLREKLKCNNQEELLLLGKYLTNTEPEPRGLHNVIMSEKTLISEWMDKWPGD